MTAQPISPTCCAAAKKRLLRALIATAVPALLVGVMYETSTHVARGWLCGEAFYDGRPTSYWRSVIEADLRSDPRDRMHAYFAERARMSWWQSVKERLLPNAKKRSSLDLVSDDNYWTLPASTTAIERITVVQELAADPDSRIGGFALDAPNLGGWSSREGYWHALLEKHGIPNP